MTKRIILIFLLSNLIMHSCNTKVVYKYQQGLANYLVETYHIDLNSVEKDTFVFLYLEYCPSCITDALQLIREISPPPENVKLFFIGEESFHDQNISVIKSLKSRSRFEVDSLSLHYSFVTGINEPLIVKINDGHIVDFTYINKDSFDKVTEFLTFQ